MKLCESAVGLYNAILNIILFSSQSSKNDQKYECFTLLHFYKDSNISVTKLLKSVTTSKK